jgi:DNA-binding NarL/FixJ family response regulator
MLSCGTGAPGFRWAEEFASILRSCDHLELKIRKVNGSSEPKAVADGPWRADLQVMAVSPGNLANGIAALIGLRREDPDIPVLALTDGQAASPLLRLMEAGASDLMGLPWCRAEILARLPRWVRRPLENCRRDRLIE